MAQIRNEEKPSVLDRFLRTVIGLVVVAALLALARYLSDVLLPFAAAVVLAYLLNPLVTAFEGKTRHRGLAVGLTIGGLAIVGLVIIALVVPLVFAQAERFGESLAKLRDDLAASIESEAAGAMTSVGPGQGGQSAGDSPEESAIGWRELREGWAQYRQDADTIPRRERLQTLRESLAGTYLGHAVDQAVAYSQSDEFRALLINAAKQVLVGGWTVVAFALNLVLALTGLIIVLLYLIFLLMDFPEYARLWPSFLPPRYREPIVDFLQQFSAAMRQYFRGQAVVALAMGILFAIGFSIIGLPIAIPFGLLVGLLNMVPYLQTVGLIPAVALAGLRAVEHDSSFLVSLGLTLLVFAVAQVIQDALITPRVMGKATGLRPVAILLGVFIWGKLLGFLGLLLAIPLTCLGIAYYRRYVLQVAPEATKLPEK